MATAWVRLVAINFESALQKWNFAVERLITSLSALRFLFSSNL